MKRIYRLNCKWLVSLALALICGANSAAPAFADIAPPPNTSGAAIAPDDSPTQVRMTYENVFADISLDGGVSFDVNFVMLNTGDKEEKMDVYFPLYSGSNRQTKGCEVRGESYYHTDWITDLAVWVWDQPQPVRIDWVKNPRFNDPGFSSQGNPEKIACWGVFAAVFPPGLNVPIEVKYTRPFYPVFKSRPSLSYILVTGAGWKGTIGQADITFRFPYPLVEDQNLYSCYPRSCVIHDRDLQWQFKDFEPTQDIAVYAALPRIWWRVLTEVNNLKLNPKDALAWKRLAQAHYDSIMANYQSRGLGLNLFGRRYQTAVETFQTAISFNPDDAGLHVELAELVCETVTWSSYEETSPEYVAWTATWNECARQIKSALEIDPKNKTALEMARLYAEFSGPFWKGAKVTAIDAAGRITFPILTPAPTAAPSPTPTPTAVVTPTATPTLTPTVLTSTSPSPTLTSTLPVITSTPENAPMPENAPAANWLWMLAPLALILAGAVVLRRVK